MTNKGRYAINPNKQNRIKSRKQKVEEKQLSGYFKDKLGRSHARRPGHG